MTEDASMIELRPSAAILRRISRDTEGAPR
jgi:hypothetical protein